jgi:hypothetical protein
MKRKAKHQLRRSSHKRFHGLTVPGYNYCGPFNSNDNGKPVNKDDAACKEHDLSEEYKDPKAYVFFNDADEKLIQELKDSTTFTGKAARRYFQWKKRVAPRMRKRTGYKTPSTVGDTPPTEKNTPAEILQDEHHFSEQDGAKKTFIEWATDFAGNGTSVRNFQPTTQATMSESQNAGAKETPLDPIVDIERGVPSWQYASLPFNHSWVWQGDTWCYDWGYRMTSPLNADISVDGSDLNTGGGRANASTFSASDTPGAGSKAMWFDFYASIYKYYSVVGCKYNILFENLSSEDIWVHEMFVSKSNPPKEADNNDILNWPNVKSHYVRSMYSAITVDSVEKQAEPVNKSNEPDASQTNTGSTSNYESQNHIRNEGSSIIKLSGHYRPGDYTRDIAQDTDIERWTAVDASPALREALLLRIKPTRNYYNDNDANTYDRYIKFKITTQLEYLVEFKELRDGLKWPVRNQPATVSIVTTTPGTIK